MRFITSEFLKNEVNENVGSEIVESKYELVMLIAKRAKQIAEEEASREKGPVDLEETKIIKPITIAVDELEADKLEISKNED